MLQYFSNVYVICVRLKKRIRITITSGKIKHLAIEPSWYANIRRQPIKFATLTSNISLPAKVDVVIVGGGIAGMTTAYLLSKSSTKNSYRLFSEWLLTMRMFLQKFNNFILHNSYKYHTNVRCSRFIWIKSKQLMLHNTTQKEQK